MGAALILSLSKPGFYSSTKARGTVPLDNSATIKSMTMPPGVSKSTWKGVSFEVRNEKWWCHITWQLSYVCATPKLQESAKAKREVIKTTKRKLIWAKNINATVKNIRKGPNASNCSQINFWKSLQVQVYKSIIIVVHSHRGQNQEKGTFPFLKKIICQNLVAMVTSHLVNTDLPYQTVFFFFGKVMKFGGVCSNIKEKSCKLSKSAQAESPPPCLDRVNES